MVDPSSCGAWQVASFAEPATKQEQRSSVDTRGSSASAVAVAADYRTRRFNGSGSAWATLEESLIERGTATSGGTVDFTTARSETCAEVARLEERTFEHSE